MKSRKYWGNRWKWLKIWIKNWTITFPNEIYINLVYHTYHISQTNHRAYHTSYKSPRDFVDKEGKWSGGTGAQMMKMFECIKETSIHMLYGYEECSRDTCQTERDLHRGGFGRSRVTPGRPLLHDKPSEKEYAPGGEQKIGGKQSIRTNTTVNMRWVAKIPREQCLCGTFAAVSSCRILIMVWQCVFLRGSLSAALSQTT